MFILKKRWLAALAAAVLFGWGITGCGRKKTSYTNKSGALITPHALRTAEKPLPPEKNPPGDIPDNQVFVKYSSSAGGYELEVPEGWARTIDGPDVSFADKLDGLSVTVVKTLKKPSVESIRGRWLNTLKKTGRAVVVKSVGKVKLTGGSAVVATYESNSEPDAVTGKQVRLENKSFFYYKTGRLAELRLWAPAGADNVDQWRRISNSFRLR